LKALLACLVSSLVVALSIAVYSTVENGFRAEMFGLMVIAFLYALPVTLVIGLPFRYVAKRLRKEGSVYYAGAGLLVGAAFMIVPMVASRHVDSSLLKTAAVLAIAGFLAGWTFDRVSNLRSD
jgi:membrane protein YdbS with pleckstrin-like domain